MSLSRLGPGEGVWQQEWGKLPFPGVRPSQGPQKRAKGRPAQAVGSEACSVTPAPPPACGEVVATPRSLPGAWLPHPQQGHVTCRGPSTGPGGHSLGDGTCTPALAGGGRGLKAAVQEHLLGATPRVQGRRRTAVRCV